MKELCERLEQLFESEGCNAGHEFRPGPFRRRIPALLGLDSRIDALARQANDGELLALEAVSVSPHALATTPEEWPAGLHIVWLLDRQCKVTASIAPPELHAANPTGRHLRMIHALYRV